MQTLSQNLNLCQILQELIREKGLTVAELARRICIPQPTIQRISNGKHKHPHQKTLTAIANFFGITVNQLCGAEPISWLKHQSFSKIIKLPLVNLIDLGGKQVNAKPFSHVIVDIDVGLDSYAIKMPDVSMEPLIQKGSILIIDPGKVPQYKNFILVKLDNCQDLLVRQLIKDANDFYIRPLSQDFENINLIKLTEKDKIFGVVVEVRFQLDSK